MNEHVFVCDFARFSRTHKYLLNCVVFHQRQIVFNANAQKNYMTMYVLRNMHVEPHVTSTRTWTSFLGIYIH